MKQTVVFFALILIHQISIGQSVQLQVQPDQINLSMNDTANLIINVTPNNFNKQLFFSLAYSDEPSLKLSIPTSPVASPYKNINASIYTENTPPGTYKLVLTTANGPVQASDTLTVNVTDKAPYWKTVFIDMSSYFTSMIIDSKDRMWLGNRDGIHCYSNGVWQHYPNPYSGDPQHLEEDGNGNIWIQYWDAVFRLSEGKYDKWTIFNSEIFDLKYYKGDMWFGTNKGIVQFDGSFWTIYDTTNSVLSSNNCYYLKKDNAGKLWALVTEKGKVPYNYGNVQVFYFNGTAWQQDKKFQCIPKPAPDNYQSNFIASLDFDRDNNMWFTSQSEIATFGKSTNATLEYWTGSDASQNHFIFDTLCKPLQRDSALFKFPQGKQVFISSQNDIYILSANNWDVIRYTPASHQYKVFNGKNSSYPLDFSIHLAEDSRGRIWAATNSMIAVYTSTDLVPLAVEDNLTNSTFEVFPVPSKDQVFLRGTFNYQRQIELSLYNQTGTVVKKEKIIGASGNINHMLDYSTLEPGFYYLKITTSEKEFVKKIVIE